MIARQETPADRSCFDRPATRILDDGAPVLPRLEVLGIRTLRGAAVITSDRHQVGRVHDVVVDLQDGVIAYVLVRLHDRGRCVALPWHTLRFDVTEQQFHVAVAAATLWAAEEVPHDQGRPTSPTNPMRPLLGGGIGCPSEEI